MLPSWRKFHIVTPLQQSGPHFRTRAIGNCFDSQFFCERCRLGNTRNSSLKQNYKKIAMLSNLQRISTLVRRNRCALRLYITLLNWYLPLVARCHVYWNSWHQMNYVWLTNRKLLYYTVYTNNFHACLAIWFHTWQFAFILGVLTNSVFNLFACKFGLILY